MLRPLAAWLRYGLSPTPEPPPHLGDWESAAARATGNGLAGLLLAAIERADAPVPAALRRKLAAASRSATARNLLLLSDAGHLARVCAERGIPLLLLKGVALLETVLADPGLRGMRDVDVLTPLQQADAVRAAARSIGYRLVAPARAPSRLRHSKQDLVRDAGGQLLRIEIHTTPGPMGRASVLCGTLLARARRGTAGGVPALLPSPEDLAAYVALHWMTEGLPQRLRDHVDLLAALSPPTLTLDRVRERAEQLGAGAAWETLVGRSRALGLLPEQGVAGGGGVRRRVHRLRGLDALPWQLRPLLAPLIAPSLAASAGMVARVAARRAGDAWASLLEGRSSIPEK